MVRNETFHLVDHHRDSRLTIQPRWVVIFVFSKKLAWYTRTTSMNMIIINGPCGVGKTTLAAGLHETMPLSFLFDIDAQMRFISHYREYQEERREITLALSQAIIDTILRLGRDIIIDKMIFDPGVIDSYYALAKKYGADVHEIILWAPKEVVMKRADDRGWRKDGLLTPEKCEMFWNNIDELKHQRTKAVIIDTQQQSEEETLKRVLELIKSKV